MTTIDTKARSAAALAEPLLPPPEEDPVVAFASEEDIEQVTLDQESLVVDETSTTPWEQGETQAPSCRNASFAILFLLQLGLVLTFSVLGMASAGSLETPTDNDHFEWGNALLFVLALTASVISVSASAMLLLLGPLAERMIQVSLVASPVACGIACVAALATGQWFMAGGMLLSALFGSWYAWHVWHRIPFAAANVATAMAAIHANQGLLAMAYGMAFLAALWTLLWGFAVAQVVTQDKDWVMECSNSSQEDNEEEDCHLNTRGKWVALGFLLSLYWTSQVIKNIFHTTIAGVVGTWWFTSEAERPQGCCNAAIYDSWVRSTIYSFGSICLGSLLVAILQVLSVIVRLARNQRDDDGNRQRQHSIMWCLLQFVVDQLERLMEYINQWAFVYVGLYGYEYWEAGSKVYQLFSARGWSVILNDHLVSRSLGFLQLVIGFVCGAIGAVLGLVFSSVGPLTGGLLGVCLGVLLSSILFQVVTSAVDTVVVCFAEAPNPLRLHHPPALSERMIHAWTTAYPNQSSGL